MLSIFSSFKSPHKTAVVILHDLIIICGAFYLAVASRFGSLWPYLFNEPTIFKSIFLLVVAQLVTLYASGLYRGVWRYSSVSDLIRVIKASSLAIMASFMLVFLFTRLEAIPRSLFFINWAYLVMGLGGGRLLYRVTRDFYYNGPHVIKNRKRLLIVGAGAGGEQLVREIKKNPALNLHVVGFVDDAPYLQRKILHGIPVLGVSDDLPTIIRKRGVQSVFIAIPSADGPQIRRIYNLIRKIPIEIKVLPQLSRMLYEKISLTSLESIKIEDLLGREEVKLDLELLEKMLTNKRVLITGAGGSIGFGLCEQLAQFKPARLIALDLSEYNVYTLEQNLRNRFPDLSLNALVGDVRNEQSMAGLFEQEKPEVVLHAAAYKHVPIMEFNPYESVRTNIIGTKITAELAVKYGAERFVLVSTDKAVNPTNVMGCTKRIAEMVVQRIQSRSPETKLMTVRFGNVLGSSGSVIPLFRKQIEAGGPLTVTHADITRFFMSIPEATKLVLQAGAMGNGGELFVLDMGEPVKILDLAKEMISLAGLHEGVDIHIKVVGLRPGEKLFEEPLFGKESVLQTNHPMVKVCRASTVTDSFMNQLNQLLILPPNSKREEFTHLMKVIVSDYQPFGDDPLPQQTEDNSNIIKFQ
jgi:FlaA1/EpsC-like NDP-sugar epimerase